MTQQSHTAGPWHLSDKAWHNIINVYSADGWCIAQVAPINNARAQKISDATTSNARLIAAAPELLEALIYVLDQAELNQDDLEPETLEVIVRAQSAIAKATGNDQ